MIPIESVDAEPVELFPYDSEGRRIATYGDFGEEVLQASRSDENLEKFLTGALYVDRKVEVSAAGRYWRLIFKPTELIGVSIPESYGQTKTAWFVVIAGIGLRSDRRNDSPKELREAAAPAGSVR